MPFENPKSNDAQTGMVIRKNRGQYLVQVDGHSIPCAISSRLRKKLIYPLADPGSLHHRVQRTVYPLHDLPEFPLVPCGVGAAVFFAGSLHHVPGRAARIDSFAADDQSRAVQACSEMAEALWNALTGIYGDDKMTDC